MPLDNFEELSLQDKIPRKRLALFATITAFVIALAVVIITQTFSSPSDFARFLGMNDGDDARSLLWLILVVAALLTLLAFIFWIVFLVKIRSRNLPNKQQETWFALCGLGSLLLGTGAFLFYIFSI